MKRVLICLLCLALLCGTALANSGPDMSKLPTPGEGLGLDLLSMMHVTGENTILSPRSLALALGMAAEGARGETLAEILTLLGAEDAAALSGTSVQGLKEANAVFSAAEIELRPEYVEALNERYGAEWFGLDGDVAVKVNGWVKEHTDGLIEQLLDEAPGADTGMILVNALAMDAEWAAPFVPEATVEDVFHAVDGDVNVQMMQQKAFFDYAERDGNQIVRLPYRDANLEMWIALPAEGGLHQLLEILANEGLHYLKSDAENLEVALGLPKMDVSDDNTLGDFLKLLGMDAAFSDAADFSGISDTPLCIDEIMQKVRVQVDENGTKAAAATSLMMKAMGMRPTRPPVEMIVNRPFVFVISDAETGNLCFVGAIENPMEN